MPSPNTGRTEVTEMDGLLLASLAEDELFGRVKGQMPGEGI